MIILGIGYLWNEMKIAEQNKYLTDKNSTIHIKLYDALNALKEIEKNHKNDSNFEKKYASKLSILRGHYGYSIIDSDITIDNGLKNEILKYFDDEPTAEKIMKTFEEVMGLSSPSEAPLDVGVEK